MLSIKTSIVIFAIVLVSIEGESTSSQNDTLNIDTKFIDRKDSLDGSDENSLLMTCQCWPQEEGQTEQSRQHNDTKFNDRKDSLDGSDENSLLMACECLPKKTNVCKNDRSYIYYKETDSCYKFHKVGATWIEAKAICEMENAHLVKIDSQEEADLLSRIIAANPSSSWINAQWKDVVLIGLRYIAGEWKYIDGTNLGASGYVKWNQGQPNNNGGQYCGSIYANGRLNDMWCSKTVVFICESNC